MEGGVTLSAIPGQVTTNQIVEVTEFDAGDLDADLQELSSKSLDSLEKTNASHEIHQKVRATFQGECDALLKELRKQLNSLFQRQADRMMQQHSNHKATPHIEQVVSAPAHRSINQNVLACDGSLSLPLALSAFDKVRRFSDEQTHGQGNNEEPKSIPNVCVIDTEAIQHHSSEGVYDTSEGIRSMPLIQGVVSDKGKHASFSRKLGSQGMNTLALDGESSMPACVLRVETIRSRASSFGTRFSDCEQEKMKKSKSLHIDDAELLRICSGARKRIPRMHKILNSSAFEGCAAMLLLINIVLLSIQVELQANRLQQGDLDLFKIINSIYCVAFIIEISLRAYAHRLSYLWGHDCGWNWLDIFVVAMQLAEILIAFTVELDTGILHTILGGFVRISRVARVVRVIRILRFFHGFKVLISAVYGTLQSSVWALLLLMIIMYVFAIIFAQFTADFLAKQVNPREDFHLLDFYFGNFTSSVFTLFKSIVGGIDWQDCVNELRTAGGFFVGLFTVYITLMQFVVINVITGLFLQSAIELAQQDQAHVIQLRLAEKQQYVDKLKELFRQLDSSGDGEISLPEFEAHLREEKMQAFFAGLEIETTDAWTIFKLLDVDGGGSVDYMEFVDGCIRLKGSAKSIEIAQLMYHHRWIMNKVCEVADFLHTVLDPNGDHTTPNLADAAGASLID